MSNITDFKPNWAIHPGQDVLEFIKFNDWTNREFAFRTGLHENTIGKILKGHDKITPEIAEKFARVFGMKASFFINLQTLYDESLPRQIRNEEEDLLKILPYPEMAKLGWVYKTTKIEEKLKNLYGFLGISSLLNLGNVGAGKIAFRKKETPNFSKESLTCWLRKGEIDFKKDEESLPPFNIIKLDKSINEIRKLTVKNFSEIKNELVNSLKESGVCLSLNAKLTNSCVNGASRWMNNNILIQISDSGKKEDIFWFTLFHEIGHALKHLPTAKKTEFVDLDNGETNLQEDEADIFAQEALISDKLYQGFVKNKNFDSISLQFFASEIGVDVGIIVGRLCKDKHISFNYAYGNKFRKKLEF